MIRVVGKDICIYVCGGGDVCLLVRKRSSMLITDHQSVHTLVFVVQLVLNIEV